MSESWLTYLLLCADGKLYCGVTNDIEKRLDAHNRGIASRFTRARLPVKLLAIGRAMEKAEAFRLEYRIKRLPRSKKLAAIQSEQFIPSETAPPG
ncbi:MAG: GIY-YIG nuclease family protein [Syntrophus sp. (in: bacteria)]